MQAVVALSIPFGFIALQLVPLALVQRYRGHRGQRFESWGEWWRS